MNIYAKNGDKVKFLNKNGHDWQLEDANEFMNEKDVLTVETTTAGDWSSTVVFKEHPGLQFNTVMFEDV